MIQYGLGLRTINVWNLSVAYEIFTTSNNKAKVLELGFNNFTQSSGGTFCIGRSSSVGISPIGAQNFIDESEGNFNLSQTKGAVNWGSAPGLPVNYNRRVSTFCPSPTEWRSTRSDT